MLRSLCTSALVMGGLMVGSATVAEAGHPHCGPGGFGPGYGYGGFGPGFGGGVVVVPRPVPIYGPGFGYRPFPVPHHHGFYGHPHPGFYGHGIPYGGYGPAPGVGFSNRNFSLWLGR
jgi:hypothetical protein